MIFHTENVSDKFNLNNTLYGLIKNIFAKSKKITQNICEKCCYIIQNFR